jgi:sulfoxide reductase heme-binding subunit YedZ
MAGASLIHLLQENARKLAYAAAFLIAAATYLAYSKGLALTPDIMRAYGFLSFSFISLALAVTPFLMLFPSFPFNAALYMSRRALGVSAFVFAFLHYAIQGALYFKWNPLYFLPLIGGEGMLTGVAALAMLFLLAATSFDFAVRKMGKHWFTLQKLVYLAYPAIIAHALFLGSDFGEGINAYSGSFLLVAAATVILEAARIFIRFSKKHARV